MNAFYKTGLALLIMAFCLSGLGAALAHSDVTADRKIEVLDVTGKKVRPLEDANRLATVFVFIAHDCPISNSYAPEVNAICNDYTRHKVAFYVVYTETDSTLATVRKHARDFGYQCPALYDSTHKLVKRTGATVTPEVVMLAPDGKTLYQGRIDDRYIDFGKMRHLASEQDLRRALDALVTNKPIPITKTKAIGCFIPQTK